MVVHSNLAHLIAFSVECILFVVQLVVLPVLLHRKMVKFQPSKDRRGMVAADMESFRFRQLLKGQAVAGLQLTWKAMTSFEGLWRFDECSDMSDEDAYASALRVRLQEKNGSDTSFVWHWQIHAKTWRLNRSATTDAEG